MDKHVLIIGGGLAGLAASIRLANMGFRVTLFEKNESLGGKMGEIRQGDFRFDTGPTLLTLPGIIDDLFIETGLNRKDFLQFEKLTTLCRYYFSDGSLLDTHSDPAQMRRNLRGSFPQQESAWFSYLAEMKKIYEAAAPVFLTGPVREARKFLRPEYLPLLLKLKDIPFFKSMHRHNARHFSDPRLVQLFDRFATYNGSDPFRAPAILNLISHVEMTLGGYYIRGGMYRLVEALQSVAEQLGVQIHTGLPVKKIAVEQGLAIGIHAEGEFIKGDYILCAIDERIAAERLLQQPSSRRKHYEPSLSGMVFLWGMNKQFPQLSQHNIFFSADYLREFRQIFRESAAPDDPTIYLSISSRIDTSHAPANGENWFVMVNMPANPNNLDWNETRRQIRSKVFRKLQKSGIDAVSHIKTEKCLTPRYFAYKLGSYQGSIYGSAFNHPLSAFLRPGNRNKKIANLFYAGGSVHPGGGIPLVMQSSKIAASLLAAQAGIPLSENRSAPLPVH
ncbi:MAG: phytoene desaturase family protein [Calditrichia bacterium]